MAGDNDVTLGEVYRILTETSRRIDALNTKVDTRLVSLDVYTLGYAALQQRVVDLETRNARFTGFLVAAFVAGLGGLVAGIVSLH